MPRKGKSVLHPSNLTLSLLAEITPDPVRAIMCNILAQRFINRLMVDGKKSIAEKIFYSALEQCEVRAKRPGIEIFEQAIRNVAPAVEVRPRRVGGSTYQVPTEVRPERKYALALRWLVTNSRKRAGRTWPKN